MACLFGCLACACTSSGDSTGGDGGNADGDAGGVRDSGSGAAIDGAASFEEADGCIEMTADAVTVRLDAYRDDESLECGSGDGPDVALGWRAPDRGRYVVTVRGGLSYGDSPEPVLHEYVLVAEDGPAPALSLRDGVCGGTELSCARANVFLEEGELSRAVVALDAEQPLTLVLDSGAERVAQKSDEHSIAALTVEPVACAEIDLGSDPSASWADWLSGVAPPVGPASCASELGNAPTEKSWRYRAPEAGRYVATLREAYGQRVALAAFSGDCIEEHACVLGEDGAAAELSFELAEGEEVALVGSVRSGGDEDWSLELEVALTAAE